MTDILISDQYELEITIISSGADIVTIFYNYFIVDEEKRKHDFYKSRGLIREQKEGGCYVELVSNFICSLTKFCFVLIFNLIYC